MILFVCLVFWIGQSNGECDEGITTKLKSHVIPNAIKYLHGRFRDVWVSSRLADILNCSYTDIGHQGNVTNYVMYKDGRGFSATGELSEQDGVIQLRGLIFPVYATEHVLGYFCCYVEVPGPGVSTICLKSDPAAGLTSINHVLEAKAVFRHLQELGIPVNDGVDY